MCQASRALYLATKLLDVVGCEPSAKDDAYSVTVTVEHDGEGGRREAFVTVVLTSGAEMLFPLEANGLVRPAHKVLRKRVAA